MSDDIKLVIGVDDSDILTSIKNHQILEVRIEKLTKEYANLDKLVNTGRISLQVYAKAVQKLDGDIDQLTVALKKGGSAVDQLAGSMGKIEKASVKARKAQSDFSNTSRKGMRRVEILAQQAGYQVGDLAVQIQGGTNAAVAFGQQGSQLLGFFGPAGAIAGAALAIGTGLIAPFIKGEKAAKGLTDRIKDLKAEIADIEGAQVLPQEQTDLLREQEGLSTRLLNLEVQLAKKKAAVAQLEENRLTKGVTYSNALGEVSSLESQILAIEQKRSENSDLLLSYQTALIDKRKALANQEERTLSQELALSQMKLQFGEDSVAVRLLENQHIVENYREELRRLGLHKTLIDRLVEMRSLTLDNDMALESSSDSAKTLAQALREAVSAMSSLASFSDSLDKKLAVSIAKVQALKSGADAAVAGSIAAMRADLDQKMSTAKSSGVDSGIVERMYGGLRGKISDLEASETERKRLEEANRSSSRDSKTSTQESSLEKLQARLKLEQELIGKSEEYVRVRVALGESYDEVEPKQIANLENQIRLIEEAKQAEQDRLKIMGTVESSMEEGFMSMIDGTKSVKDAFKDMARQIIAELMRILVVKKMVSGITSFFGFADGGVFSGGSQVKAFADGGVVGGPTTFPMSGGQTGLMGEAGPEAIMPLKRGANGKLGVQMEGGTQGNVVVNQSFNFAANGDESVKKLIAQAAPQIANMTQKQIMDSRRRGGAMKSTFG